MQKILTFFQQKTTVDLAYSRNFNETLTNDVVNFEQPGHGLLHANNDDAGCTKLVGFFLRGSFNLNVKLTLVIHVASFFENLYSSM